MASGIWVNIGSGNGLLPDGTKPYPLRPWPLSWISHFGDKWYQIFNLDPILEQNIFIIWLWHEILKKWWGWHNTNTNTNTNTTTTTNNNNSNDNNNNNNNNNNNDEIKRKKYMLDTLHIASEFLPGNHKSFYWSQNAKVFFKLDCEQRFDICVY